VRKIVVALALISVLVIGSKVLPQSPTASITGIVFDPESKVIPGAEIIVVNDLTRVQFETKTNGEGIYTVVSLPPGPYRVQVSKSDFKTIIKPDIILNVGDALSLNFTLPVGASSVSVTVEGGAPVINTTDASVSTIVDQSYVENMPLNGRSFQDLILLTPGVVTNSPQNTGAIGATGEFSVNGQRTESNYYLVDGVSGNIGTFPGPPQFPSTSGSLPASTALGTTQGLVSVEALQEFRVESSTYSAEYGRNPGGQFSLATKFGTNQWHGRVFDYLRNDAFDANDWFNNYDRLPKSPLRQNDFGGTLGGPVHIPHIYNGQDKTFFFFSYEGLRLLQPQEATVSYVPDANLRQATPEPLKAVLNGFPAPNGPAIVDSSGNPLGLAEFVGAWSNPSQINAYSIRMDHAVSERLRLFFRYGGTQSSSESREGGNFSSPSSLIATGFTTRTYTLGATSMFSSGFNNDFRLNYSSNSSAVTNTPDSFGGAQAVDMAALQGIGPGSASNIFVDLAFGGSYFPELFQLRQSGEQRQWNVVDAANLTFGRHQLKFGIDFRRLTPIQEPYTPSVSYIYLDQQSVIANDTSIGSATTTAPAHPVYKNFSSFVQDEWHISPCLNVSMGIRWDVNPAPSDSSGHLPYTAEGKSLATLTLAPEGTPLWKTSWFNFAPRLGVAYLLHGASRFATVLRGGFGVFFDTGQQDGAWGYNGVGFQGFTSYGSLIGLPVSFPLPIAEVTPPIVNPPVAPYGTVYAFADHLQLPYTLQWNVALQQALGKSQAFTITYVGANGRKLLAEQQQYINSINPNFNSVFFFRNGLTSDYDALQLQFQRRLSQGFTALASYTWGHSIDYGSNNTALPYVRGNSDYDVRQSVSAALSYTISTHLGNRYAQAALDNWGVDGRFSARTGFPVTLQGPLNFDPATGAQTWAGLDLVPGVPLYLYGSQFPGGRAINPNAFAVPSGCSLSFCPTAEVGTAPRNFVRGFGAWQTDLAIRREFPIHERLKLQFRVEAFNVFNHPNFGLINANYCSPSPTCTFGQATQTLASSLGVLSPLYQMGGPRSLQLALKLMF
jgi:Carboxypeptidase regulatory-like domain